jgi:hypothetical protein
MDRKTEAGGDRIRNKKSASQLEEPAMAGTNVVCVFSSRMAGGPYDKPIYRSQTSEMARQSLLDDLVDPEALIIGLRIEGLRFASRQEDGRPARWRSVALRVHDDVS